MNFDIDDDQVLLGDTSRKYLQSRESLSRTRRRIETAETVDLAEWKAGADLGWASMLIPAESGGGSITDQPLVDLVVLAGELGRVLHPAPFLPTNVVADAISCWGNEDQRKLLSHLAAGDMLAAWCTSADSVPDVSCIGVVATPTATGYLLQGTSSLVHGASVADQALVTARTADGLIMHFLVALRSKGIAVRPLSALDLTRRYSKVYFDQVEVELPQRIGPAEAGLEILARAGAVATVVQVGEAAGAVDYLVDETVRYAKDRVQFGRPIGSFQAIKHRLADLHVAREAVRATAYYAALALGDGQVDAAEAVAVAGAYVGDTYAWVCGEALQLHGGIGFTWEHDMHLFLRRAKVDQVLYGEPHWHRERLCRILEQSTEGAA
ncbi:MAG: acyl-CoA/acyl-ACP dehydrogenase [Acidobacteriota bacterium]|nr:acyl-CoA/acyl-ACP dehydrogenase [Acidobacteriota bacterium]